ncbi:MAG: hypothetical protein ACXVBW_09825, partial [Bdellovibrionota bacterium]
RPTGEVNPDAPLGHHIGQDVGHISSTVIGTQLRLSDTQLEVSTFNGTEPSPDAVDLPFGVPNSAAIRGTQYFGRDYVAMLSFAYVGTPEPSDPTIPWVARISASGYGVWPYRSIKIYAASIYGGIIGYDHASYLMSFTEELRVQAEHQAFWARIEVLQRTAAELAIATAPGDPNAGHFVGEIMVGYTHEIVSAGGFTLAAGGAFHQDFLPTEFQAAYGGGTPWGFRAFVQLSGMEHWGGMF